MKSFRISVTAACMAAGLCLASAATAQAPATAPKGEGVVASVEVTATVTKVDQKTREVTVRTDDGQERSFVASDDVKNLAQLKPGDMITATYAEAFVYEVKKGGTAADGGTVVA